MSVSKGTILSTSIALLATSLLIYAKWSSLPQWIKGRKKSGSNNSEDAEGDLSNPTVILAKLIRMMNLCNEVTDDMPWYKIYASFMSLVHLRQEMIVAHPNFRNEMYESVITNSAEMTFPSQDELSLLSQYLEFADWAYEISTSVLKEKLSGLNYLLIRHDVSTEPGRVGHFLCVNHELKQFLLAIKGTSTVADVLTDVIGDATPHTLSHPITSDSETIDIRCHEGMFTAAQVLASDLQHMIERFFLPQQYKIVICGHSLGAGVSCLLGVLLKSRIEGLRQSSSDADQILKVYAFATPPCLDGSTSEACASFTTSVVNNTDCVPRLSVANLVMMNRLFHKVDARLQELGRSPDSFTNLSKFLSDIMSINEDTLLSPKELRSFAHEVLDGLEEHALYVPGRIVLLWQDYKSDAVTKTDVRTTKEMESTATVHVRASSGGGSVVNALRQIEFATTMISDHGTASYRDQLQRSLSPPPQTAAEI